MIVVLETLESRALFTAAFDLTSLTQLRADPNYSGIDGSGIGIAVLDSGTWAAHPDLRNNFLAFFDAVKNPASSPGSTNVNDAFDPDGHGTHTAGTAASSNPNIGVATGAKLIAVRALPSENEAQPSFDTVANGLQWVLNNVSKYNIKVVNMSLGVPSVNDNTGRLTDQESVLIRKLEAVGVTVVAAAGNNYASFAPSPGAATPAAYSTLTVSSVWADSGSGTDFPVIGGSGGNVTYFAQENDAAPDRFSATSQRSTLDGQIAAPGTNILSTWNSSSKLYQVLSGTSMASPFIAGTVALMQETAWMLGGRYLTPAQVQTILVDSGDTIADSNVSTNSRIPIRYDSSGNAVRAGANQDLPETGLTYKRVDVYAAVRAVRAFITGSTIDDPEEPPVSGTDPDATIATATVVPGINGTATYDFSGRIGTDGTVTVGASDVDVYKLQVLSTGVVSAQLALPSGGSAFGATVRLFDATGAELTKVSGSFASYPSLVSGRLAPGTYYIAVSASGNESYSIADRSGVANGSSTGDYTITIGLANPDPNGVPQGAFALDLLAPNDTDPRTGALATAISGSIDSDPNPLNESGPRIQIGATDIDMFRVVAPDDGILTIDTLGAGSSTHALDGVNTYIRVFDANFNVINVPVRFFNGVDAVVELNVTRGSVYYIGIGSSGNTTYDAATSFDRTSTTGQTGNYDAYFSFDNGDTNGTAFTATRKTVGSSFNAAIGSVGGQTLLGADNGNKDVNFYVLTVPSSGLIDLTATPTSSGFTPVMSLFRLSADRTSITRDADTTGRAARIIAPVTAGETIYVAVTGDGNNDFKWFAPASGSGGQIGTFFFTSAMRSSSDLAKLTNSSIRFGTPTTISANVPVYANLGTTNAVETGAASVNLYRYTANFTGELSIRVSVPGDQPTDPFLRLFDENGVELAYNDDAANNTRGAALTYSVVAGRTYYIGVNPSSANARAYDPLTGSGAAEGIEGDYVLLVSAPPKLSISAPTLSQESGAVTSVTFTFTLDEPATQAVTADFATYDITGLNGAVAGTDYTSLSQQISIAAGQTTATVTVSVNADLTPGRVRLIGGAISNLTNARKGTMTVTAVILPPTAQGQVDGADVEALSLSLSPKGPVTPADKIPAVLTLSSTGTALAKGKFSLMTVISKDPWASPDDITLAATKKLNLKLVPGKSQNIKLTTTVPSSLEAGTWYAISYLVPATAGIDLGLYDNSIASAAFNVEWRFGTFEGHKNKKLTLFDASGTPVTFSVSGTGSGVVSRDDSNLLSATVTGTNAKSSFSMTPVKAASASVLNVTVESGLKSLLSSKVNVLGDLALPTPPPKVVQVRGR